MDKNFIVITEVVPNNTQGIVIIEATVQRSRTHETIATAHQSGEIRNISEIEDLAIEKALKKIS